METLRAIPKSITSEIVFDRKIAVTQSVKGKEELLKSTKKNLTILVKAAAVQRMCVFEDRQALAVTFVGRIQ